MNEQGETDLSKNQRIELILWCSSGSSVDFEAVQDASELRPAVEEALAQPQESVPRQQAVGSGLVALSHRSSHLQFPGHPLQPPVHPLAEPGHMLHVVHVAPEQPSMQTQELSQTLRQRPPGQHLDQVREVVGAVEGHPANGSDAVEQRWPPEESRKFRGLHASPPVSVEVDPVAAEKIDRVRGVVVLLGVEVPEIELPDERIVRPEIR